MNEKIKKILNKAFETKTTVILIGKYGIGKSQTVYEFAKEKAEELNKKFIVWHNLTEEEKKKVFEKPEDYFILVDLKIQNISEPSYLTGIPLILQNGKQKIIWELPDFAKILTNPRTFGLLFLDEINMANPSLQSIAFEISLQHKLGMYSLSKNVFVVMAGNDLDSNIAANIIPKPLINRCIFVKFEQPSVDEWIKWAVEKQIDERIISFVKLFQEVYSESEDDMEQSTTPRSFELLSNMIKNEDDLDYILEVSKALLHETTAHKFYGFLKKMHLIEYKKYVKNPKRIDELDIEDKYALISIIAQHTNEFSKEEILKVTEHLIKTETDIGALFLNFLKNEDTKKFNDIIQKLDEQLIDKVLEMII